MVISTAASFVGAAAGVGWALWGVTSPGGVMEVSPGGATPFTHPHQRRRGSIPSPPTAQSCSPPRGVIYLQ